MYINNIMSHEMPLLQRPGKFPAWQHGCIMLCWQWHIWTKTNSSDLDTIEHIWAIAPATQTLAETRQALPQQVIGQFIAPMPRMCQSVRAAGGGHTCYWLLDPAEPYLLIHLCSICLHCRVKMLDVTSVLIFYFSYFSFQFILWYESAICSIQEYAELFSNLIFRCKSYEIKPTLTVANSSELCSLFLFGSLRVLEYMYCPPWWSKDADILSCHKLASA